MSNNRMYPDQRDSAHYWPYEYDIAIQFQGNRAERALLVASLVLVSTPQPCVESLLAMLEKELPKIARALWVEKVESIRDILINVTFVTAEAQEVAGLMAQAVLKHGTPGNPQR